MPAKKPVRRAVIMTHAERMEAFDNKIRAVIEALVRLRQSRTLGEWRDRNEELVRLARLAGYHIPAMVFVEPQQTIDAVERLERLDAQKFQSQVGEILGLGATASRSEIIAALEKVRPQIVQRYLV